VLSDIHLIFGTLLCHTKIQIKFETGFDPLIFHEVMVLGLREKCNKLSVFHTSFVRIFMPSFEEEGHNNYCFAPVGG
jgi:hypothetical protein